MSMKEAIASNWVAENANATDTGFTLLGTSKGYASFSRAFKPSQDVFYSASDESGNREAGFAKFDGSNLVLRQPTASLVNGIYTSPTPPRVNFTGQVTVACTFNAAAFNKLWKALQSFDPDGDGDINIPPELIDGLVGVLNSKADQVDLEKEIQDRIDGDQALQSQIDALDPDGDRKVEWGEIDGKPSKYPPESHTHDQDDIDGLQDVLDEKADQDDLDALEANLNQEVADREAGDNALKSDLNDLTSAFNNHDHSLDELSDVSAGSPARDDLISWNGSQWEAHAFAFMDSILTFKGGISPEATAPSDPEGGDIYIFDANGTTSNTWGGASNVNVVTGKFVGWVDQDSDWHLLGDMAEIGVTRVAAGVGIHVDDSQPSAPVVSIDRTETDKWYENLWEQSGNDIYYNTGNVGIGTNPSSGDKLKVAGHGSFNGNVFSRSLVDRSSGGLSLTQSIGSTGPAHALIPADNAGDISSEAATRGEIGSPAYPWASAHFSGAVNVNQLVTTGSVSIDGDATFSGNVGIGMAPEVVTSSLSAKEQLKEWKTKAKKAPWPVVTDGAFEQEPTEDLVARWIETRAAGDRLQVAGSISATGTVNANQLAANLDVTAGRNAQVTGTVYGGDVESHGLLRAGKGANEFTVSSAADGVLMGAFDRVGDQYTQMHLRAHEYKFSTDGTRSSADGTTNQAVENALLIDPSGSGTFSGTVTAKTFFDENGPIVSAFDIVEAFRSIKNAVSDETTVEGIQEALTNSLGGLIEKFEAMANSVEPARDIASVYNIDAETEVKSDS